jgi:hypothetical protein
VKAPSDRKEDHQYNIFSEAINETLAPEIAETYAPVSITVAYGGQSPVPKPFVMVLIWIKTSQGWKMTARIPIPVLPDPPAQ